MTNFQTIIIGAGLFGSAAARHLSRISSDIAVIGPAEPTHPESHEGVFASHYDEARLTRRTERNSTWIEVTKMAMDQYRKLEAASGISFYRPVGLFFVGDKETKAHKSFRERALEQGVMHTYYAPGNKEWQEYFPDYDFPDRFSVIHEPAPAGTINPRKMVRAQLNVATQHEALILRETVTRVNSSSDAVEIVTREGNRYTAKKALLSTGAFTNFFDLLPKKIALRPKTETIILGEVSPSEYERLKDLPTLGYSIEDPEISDIYMTPPVIYPDGKYYFKMGANSNSDLWPETLSETQEWFRNGDSEAHRAAFERAMRNLLPTVEFLSFRMWRCIVSYTPSGTPTIDRINKNLYVAAGGNGGGAKGSDGWGQLAAGFAHDGRWPSHIPRDPFEVQYQ